jgi:hypothetical protein
VARTAALEVMAFPAFPALRANLGRMLQTVSSAAAMVPRMDLLDSQAEAEDRAAQAEKAEMAAYLRYTVVSLKKPAAST